MAFAQPKISLLVQPGDPKYFDVESHVTSGTYHNIINETVPANKKWALQQIIINSRFESNFRVLGDGALFGSGRTSGATPMAALNFIPARPIGANENLVVQLRTRDGAPSSDIAVHVQLSELDI